MRQRNPMRWRALALGAVLALASAAPAGSLDLESAKQQGLLGERADGFVGVVVAEPASELQALADTVNERRRARYQEIAARNGTELDAVAALAGAKLTARAPSGQWVTDAEGNWYRK
jgi:hypothetical protein